MNNTRVTFVAAWSDPAHPDATSESSEAADWVAAPTPALEFAGNDPSQCFKLLYSGEIEAPENIDLLKAAQELWRFISAHARDAQKAFPKPERTAEEAARDVHLYFTSKNPSMSFCLFVNGEISVDEETQLSEMALSFWACVKEEMFKERDA